MPRSAPGDSATGKRAVAEAIHSRRPSRCCRSGAARVISVEGNPAGGTITRHS